MKLTKQELKTRDEHVEALSTAEKIFFDAANAYNKILTEADAFIGEVRDRLQSEFDDKSEKWQELDAGVSAQEMIKEWDDLTFNDVELELNHAELLAELPTETE